MSTNIDTTDKLNSFISSLNNYTKEYEHILTDISLKLPKIERQIDDNVIEARELLNFIFSREAEQTNYGVKHELSQFSKQLDIAMRTLIETGEVDNTIFNELRKTIEISENALNKIEDIYNISENLKVFAINSIVYSQKEGSKGKGYQIISGQFIKLSEDIAKGTSAINQIGNQMNDKIKIFFNRIEDHEKFNHEHITSISNDSQKLMKLSNKSVENFSMILNDLLTRIDSVKGPTFKIMMELQKQDIIQQQMVHLMEVMDDILVIIGDNSTLLNLHIDEGLTELQRDEYLNIATLLKFLLLTTEKQMYRINKDLLEMIDNMESEFSRINQSINDVNNDKELISQLVISKTGSESDASIINLIFQTPKNTIGQILTNLDLGQKQKKGIISVFSEINNLVLSERKITTTFIPIIELITNLLLLARIEQARNSLNISDDLGNENSVFSQSAFSELGNIIHDMDESEILINRNLDQITISFADQKLKYAEMEENLNNSLIILKNTENLFTDNYNSVMEITNVLSSEITEYSGLFKNLRVLHNEMNHDIEICTELRLNFEKKLDALGGSIDLNDCHFKDTSIQSIVEKLTVDEERMTIASAFSELEIEASSGSAITLF